MTDQEAALLLVVFAISVAALLLALIAVLT